MPGFPFKRRPIKAFLSRTPVVVAGASRGGDAETDAFFRRLRILPGVAGAVAAVGLSVAISLGAALPAAAQSAPRPRADASRLPQVEISTMRDPVAKSYRRIIRGIEVFERRRDLAPGASLRFKLLPRQQDTGMEGISLRIVGDTVAVPIPVAVDNTFVIPRNPLAFEEDAIVVPNRKSGSMTWRTDIRTPGLPPNTRRLGDLRLECLVGTESGLISNYPPSILGEIARLTDWRPCGRAGFLYLFFADRPLWSVTLVHGNRRQVLSVDQMYAGVSLRPMTQEDRQYCDCQVLLDRTYFAPLGDASWPDDTLLELEYMDP